MSQEQTTQSPQIEARSPFEYRVDQARGVSDSVVKQALTTGEMGFLHSFTTGSAVDGPGMRLVAWTAGCSWRCLYCHNPDTWNMMNGIPVTLSRAIEELRRYGRGLKLMGGGLTISGGEALMQDRFVVRLFKAAKTMGIHTALDTNGELGERLTDEELKHVDLVLLDMKAWDREKHLRLTGKDNRPTLEFARRLAKRRVPIWVRFVLVPNLTDDAEDIQAIAEFAAELGNVERVDVLPFHQMGKFKWERLGLNYTLAEVPTPSRDLVERTCGIFRSVGLKAY